ncbi:MAG: hypothetical protein J0I09_01640 [Sphingobacteriia bacterium]|nr:hypothetical protein [Sphingobacteriia bacterium]
MPVTTHQLIAANAANPGYAIARVLAVQAVQHFNAVRPAHAGIGPASCCAAFAVNAAPAAGFPALTGQVYSATFGNSQIAAGGLDMGPVGGHAERCAITAAGNNHLTPIAPVAVLFVELSPCMPCGTWLGGGGGGVANPYNFGAAPAGLDLHVWYAFPYDAAGIAAMVTFHNRLPADQAARAAALTW